MSRSKIKLTGDSINDLKILEFECSNNNQICYHIKINPHLIDYLKNITGLDAPVMVLFYHFKEGIKQIPKCICGKNRIYHCYGYRPTCGRKKCKNIIREESKKTYCLQNYGVEFVTQLESMKQKSKATCLQKYGVDNSLKSKDIIFKRKENNLRKYGVSDPIVLKHVRGDNSKRGLIKIQDGLPNGYMVLESDHFSTSTPEYYYKLICPKNHIFTIGKSTVYTRKRDKIEICPMCNEYVGSKGEQELFEYISSIYTKNIDRSNRKLIKPYEIDMVLEDIQLCIEFNGDYWHSDKISDEQYHITKLNMCLERGYNLIQVRENDWNVDKDVVKRKIYNIINNIYDKNDLQIEDEYLIFDQSWYDSRIIEGLEPLLVKSIGPQLIDVGNYRQWNCGVKIYKIY